MTMEINHVTISLPHVRVKLSEYADSHYNDSLQSLVQVSFPKQV